MKLFCIALLFFLSPVVAKGFTNDTIHFVKDKPWAEVLAMAEQQQKMIFVDVYTTWCGPCMKMNKTTFKEKAIVAYMNEHFVNVKADAEKGEGVHIAKQYGVMGYPTFLFIHHKGQKLASFTNGFLSNEDFLKKVQETKAEAETLIAPYQSYQNGRQDNDFLIEYMKKLDNSGVSAEKEFEKYWQQRPQNEPISKKELHLIKQLMSNNNFFIDCKSTLFKLYFENLDSLKKEFPNKPKRINLTWSEAEANKQSIDVTTMSNLRCNLRKYLALKDVETVKNLIEMNEKHDYILKKYQNKPRKLAKIRKHLYTLQKH